MKKTHFITFIITFLIGATITFIYLTKAHTERISVAKKKEVEKFSKFETVSQSNKEVILSSLEKCLEGARNNEEITKCRQDSRKPFGSEKIGIRELKLNPKSN
jgi:hypothetical protein